jgi:hypothetical protein
VSITESSTKSGEIPDGVAEELGKLGIGVLGTVVEEGEGEEDEEEEDNEVTESGKSPAKASSDCIRSSRELDYKTTTKR